MRSSRTTKIKTERIDRELPITPVVTQVHEMLHVDELVLDCPLCIVESLEQGAEARWNELTALPVGQSRAQDALTGALARANMARQERCELTREGVLLITRVERSALGLAVEYRVIR